MSCLRYPAAAQEARIEHFVVLNVHFVRDELYLHLSSQQRKVVEFSTICDESVHPTARKIRERAKLYKPNAMKVFSVLVCGSV